MTLASAPTGATRYSPGRVTRVVKDGQVFELDALLRR
jgi:hypothetical protein